MPACRCSPAGVAPGLGADTWSRGHGNCSYLHVYNCSPSILSFMEVTVFALFWPSHKDQKEKPSTGYNLSQSFKCALWSHHGIISSPLMTQGGQPCKQQNCAQGGPPCASYKLRRAVRPPNSKMVRRADRPVYHICYAGRSALLTAKWCAVRTAQCII